jgi:hypothetical protein
VSDNALCGGNAGFPPSVSPSMSRTLAAAMLALLLASAGARAQSSTPPASTVPADSSPSHRLPVDASKVLPTQSSYRLLLTRDTVSSPLGDQRFDVTSLDYAGTPALLLARSGGQGVTMVSDSLVVRRSDLRPLHWVAAQGVARVAAEFTPDSVYGAMTSPLGKQNIVLANRADILVNAMAIDVIVAGLPLATAWRDSATMLVIDAGGTVVTPVTLSVEGEERITVPAGEFDCWIVAIEAERASGRLWVTKQGQLVARSEQILPELDGATLSRVLVQTDSPSLVPASARLPQ